MDVLRWMDLKKNNSWLALALLRGFFCGFSGFESSLHKNQHVQIPIGAGLRTRTKASQYWCGFLSLNIIFSPSYRWHKNGQTCCNTSSSPLLGLPPLQARSLARVYKLTIGRAPSGLPLKLLFSIRLALEVTGVELTDLSTITINIPIYMAFSCPIRFI